jgi:RNA polymerase sigma-70 factor (ECF subfamily)
VEVAAPGDLHEASDVPGSGLELDAAVADARRGDEAAFTSLFTELQPRLLRYLRIRIGDACQDVASETWLRVIADLHRFDGDGQDFVAWLFTIARYRAIDAARAARKRPTRLPVDFDGPGAGPGVEETVIGRASVADVRGLLAQLPADQADAVALRHVAGLDVATVAALLAKSPTAVRINSHRGLRRLATMLGVEQSEESA